MVTDQDHVEESSLDRDDMIDIPDAPGAGLDLIDVIKVRQIHRRKFQHQLLLSPSKPVKWLVFR